MNSLADLDHPEKLNLELQSGMISFLHFPLIPLVTFHYDYFSTAESYGPITLEYLNYAVALGVYSVRYPAVFWSCNKPLATIFSFQLIVNSAQSLLAYVGMSVLYKASCKHNLFPLRILLSVISSVKSRNLF